MSCACPGRGRMFRPVSSGARCGTCSCCGAAGDVVVLPTGAGDVANCADCLYPSADRPMPTSRPKGFRHERTRFKRETRSVYLPASLVLAIEADPTPIPNFVPSEQRQRYFSIRLHESEDRA